MIIPKNWGTEESIVSCERPMDYGTGLKRLTVLEGHRSSVHKHPECAEVVYVEEGMLWFEVGETPQSMSGRWLQEGDSIEVTDRKGVSNVPLSPSWHRFTGIRNSVLFVLSPGRDMGTERYGAPGSSSGKVPEEEFKALMRKLVSSFSKPHVDLAQAKLIAENLRQERKVIGMVNGCFDLLHPGHVELLRQARDKCDVLFVAVNTDKSVKLLKGNDRPFVPESGRMVMLGSNRYVDYVVPIDETTCLGLVDAIQPDVYVTTTERTGDGPEAREVKMKGGKVEIVKVLPGYNTTSISTRFV